MERRVLTVMGDSLRHSVPVTCLPEDSARSRYRRGLVASAQERARLMGRLAVFQHLGLQPDTSADDVEPALAWYEPETQSIWITADTSLAGATLDALLLHELVHAMHLQKYGPGAVHETTTWDQEQARRCVVEGQAQWAEFQGYYMSRKDSSWAAGELSFYYWALKSVSLHDLAEEAERSNRRAGPSPASRREYSLLRYLPTYWYWMGMVFADQAMVAGGKARMAELWREPPVSMKQILRPRQYLLEDMRPSMFRPGPVDSIWAGATELNRDSYGEVLLRLYLETHGQGERAGALTHGWDGDLLLLVQRGGGEPVLLWWTLWDAPWSAAGFAESYGATLKDRGVKKSLGPGLWRGDDRDRRWAVWREDCRVLIIEDAPAADLASLRAAMSRVRPEPMPRD